MYHPAVIAAREARLLAVPALRALYPQGIPVYSVEECRARTAALQAAYQDGKLLRALDAEEQAFIAAVQLRVQIDFPYFGERFVWIDQEGHGLRPLYPLWESQTLVLEQLGRIEHKRIRDGHPDGLLINVLKARQLGVSTLSSALVSHRILTRPHTRGLEGADVEDQAGYLFRMADRIYKHLPWFLRPRQTSFNKNREATYANESFLKTAWGKSTRGALAEVGGQGSKGAIGRGQTFSCVHISELATWDNPEQLNSALFPAIPVHEDTLVVLESTAEHAQDWWHQQWLTTAEGLGRFHNVFIPWYAEPKKYSLPAPEGWVPQPSTLEHAAKAKRDSVRWLGKERELSRDQMYWYEQSRAYAARMGQLHKFRKEYPADDEECFQYAGHAIFSTEQLEAIDAVGSRRPLRDVWRVDPAREVAQVRRDAGAVLGVPGAGGLASLRRDPRPDPPLSLRQPGAFGPAAADLFPVPPGYGFQRLTPAEIVAVAEDPTGKRPYDPVKLIRSGALAIWEYPRSRGARKYVMSVDVGEGLGGDYTVIDVLRVGTIDEPAEQVAQWASHTHSTQQVAFICDAIGRLYADQDGIEALAAIEINNHGLAVQDMLQLHLGYSHFYVWEYADAGDPAKRFSSKIGWVTSSRTRPMLIAGYYAAITDMDPITGLPEIILNSPLTRGELRHFITEGTIGEAEAARGQHDDGVMASAIGRYVAWRLAGGEQEPIEEKRRRRAALRANQHRADARAGYDWRNSAATAAEADSAGDDDDGEWIDDRGTLSFAH